MNATGYCILILCLWLNRGYSDSLWGVTDHTIELTDGRIELVINNIKNCQGVIRIGMYTNGNGYPDAPATGFTFAKDTIRNGILRVAISVSRAGTYAFSVLDDENENGRMDYEIGIIPHEGFGFSNNPKVSRKAPPFSETSFRYDSGLKKIEIRMVYI